MKKFFENENQGYSPSISDNGKLKIGNKADLLGLLEALVSSHDTGSSPTVDAITLKATAIVNMLQPSNARTFSDYADPPPPPHQKKKKRFGPYVMNQMKHANR